VADRSEPNRNPAARQFEFKAVAAALGDPVRSKLLMAIADGRDGVSVRQIAARIREPQRKVRYHLEALVDQGLVAVASERKRRGVVERYYRAETTTLISNELHDSLDADQAQNISLQILKAILGDASAAASAGLFAKRSGYATIRISREVDLQAWEELAAAQEEALQRLQAIAAEAETRLRAGNQESIRAVVSLLLFETPPWPE
jgi:DNA-binding transcriptional ArsR family regulator